MIIHPISPFIIPQTQFSSKFDSPLSERAVRQRKDLSFAYTFFQSQICSFSLDYSFLSLFYNYDFNRHSPENEVLRIYLYKIENLIRLLENHPNTPNLRNYLKILLATQRKEFIFSEVGLIYFYLDNFRSIPCTQYFNIHRLKEITSEIQALKASELSDFPSGITLFLLRAICNMAIDTEGKRNMGGLYAILRFLSGQLSSFFNENHLIKIQAVIKHALYDSEFIAEIEKSSFKIHPSMELFIRADLQLPDEVPLTSQHIKIACLLALIGNLRQFTQPNCFAVGMINYATIVSPALILKKYYEILETGAMPISSAFTIPILALLPAHLIKSENLNSKMHPHQFSSILPQTALRSIGIDAFTFRLSIQQPLKLKQLLKLASQKTNNSNLAFLKASLVARSFKKNILQGLLVNAIEFFEANLFESQPIRKLDKSQKRPVKIDFIKFIKEVIKNQVKQEWHHLAQRFNPSATCKVQQLSPISHRVQNDRSQDSHFFQLNKQSLFIDFLEAFEKVLMENFWLQSVTDKIHIHDNNLSIQLSGKTISFQNSKNFFIRLNKLYENHRKLIYIYDGKINILDSFSKLIEALQQIIDDLNKQHKFFEIKNILVFIKETLLKNNFSKQLSIFLENVNTDCLHADEYIESQMIIFEHDGGTPNHCLKFFPLKYTEHTFAETNPIHSFGKMIDYLNKLPNKQYFASAQTPLLCSSITHVFLLHPYLFAPLWNTSEKPTDVLKKYSLDPLNSLLQRPISEQKILTVLQEVLINQLELQKYLSLFKGPLTANKFMDVFLKNVDKKYIEPFLHTLTNEITKISISEIKWDPFLNKLFASQSASNILNPLKAQLESEMSNFSEISVMELAGRIQRIFSYFDKFFTKIDLEFLICKELNLPVSWCLGDLNYSQNVESPDYALLAWKPIPGKITFCQRMGDKESPLTTSTFEAMQSMSIYSAL